jgi:hypothetical protein
MSKNKAEAAFLNVASWGNVNPKEFPDMDVPKHDLPCNFNGVGPRIPGRKCGWGKCGPGPLVPTMLGVGVGMSDINDTH